MLSNSNLYILIVEKEHVNTTMYCFFQIKTLAQALASH